MALISRRLFSLRSRSSTVEEDLSLSNGERNIWMPFLTLFAKGLCGTLVRSVLSVQDYKKKKKKKDHSGVREHSLRHQPGEYRESVFFPSSSYGRPLEFDLLPSTLLPPTPFHHHHHPHPPS